MAVRRIDPKQAAAFKVEIDGIDTALVQTVSGLNTSFEVAEYFSENTRIKVPTISNTEDVTLEMVAMLDNSDVDFEEWHLEAREGLPSEFFKDVRIHELGNDNTIVRTYLLKDTFVSALDRGTFDLSDSETRMREITLTYSTLEIE